MPVENHLLGPGLKLFGILTMFKMFLLNPWIRPRVTNYPSSQKHINTEHEETTYAGMRRTRFPMESSLIKSRDLAGSNSAIFSTIFAAATGIVGASVTLLGIMAGATMSRSGYNVQLAAGTITAAINAANKAMAPMPITSDPTFTRAPATRAATT